jgi:hypothetical protein
MNACGNTNCRHEDRSSPLSSANRRLACRNKLSVLELTRSLHFTLRASITGKAKLGGLPMAFARINP